MILLGQCSCTDHTSEHSKTTSSCWATIITTSSQAPNTPSVVISDFHIHLAVIFDALSDNYI